MYTYISRWLFESDETKKDVDCKDSEFCYAVPDDCDYSIKPIGKQNFGAEIEGLHLGYVKKILKIKSNGGGLVYH